MASTPEALNTLAVGTFRSGRAGRLRSGEGTGMLTDLLFRKLRLRDPGMSLEEGSILEAAVSHCAEVPADVDLVSAGEMVDTCKLVVEGWSCRYGELPDGRRQIMALHVPGDFVDLHSFPLRRMDHGIATLTPSRVAFVPHGALTRITEQHPHLTRLLWLSTLMDAAILRQWLMSTGRRSAVERLAHLLCELQIRLEVVGLAPDSTLRLPLTQVELADVLGISYVHTNRVIAELRERGLVLWRGESIQILDRSRLERFAHFDHTYLMLEPMPR